MCSLVKKRRKKVHKPRIFKCSKFRVHNLNQRWEFITEKKKVRKQDNKNSTKKGIKKTRKKERKHALDQEKKKKLSFFLDHFLGRVLVFLFSFINSNLRSLEENTSGRHGVEVP